MSKSVYTPGPWHLEQPWAGFSALRGPKGELIFGLTAGSEDEAQSPQVCEANGRLIAAAPEMLDALRLCLQAIDEGREYQGMVIQNVEAAIKKAEGK